MKSFVRIALAGAATAALAACSTSHVDLNAAAPAAVVAPAAVMGATSAAPFNAFDQDFALGAASGNMFEIGASQMARSHTSSADVLQLADMINRDHTQAMNELMAIMRGHGMAVPQDMAPDKRHLMDKLGTTRGSDFDQVFVMEAGVRGHETDIAAYQQKMPRLADPDLKAWAARTLPHMQQHLATAQQIASKLG